MAFDNSLLEVRMSGRDKWIMVVILSAVAWYFFEWKALYLYGVGALIYFFTRGKK